MKTKLLVSFSGGETSGYMAHWLKTNMQDKYEMVFIFANTGQENEETLKFADQCDKQFNLNLIWIEAEIDIKRGQPTGWNIVSYKSASRHGEPFEQGIKKFALPNMNNPWCTRDLPMTKPKINFWWKQQKFRLDLKGYEGNCKWCWKKTDNKLMTIAKEKPEYFDFAVKMEKLYEDFVPGSKQHSLQKPVRMFRGNKSVKDIFKNSKQKFKKPKDDSDIYNWQISIFDEGLDTSNGCDESCEIH